jgi:hypothetical protein
MICGFASALYFWWGTGIAPLWYGVFSMLVVFAVGIVISLFEEPPPDDKGPLIFRPAFLSQKAPAVREPAAGVEA